MPKSKKSDIEKPGKAKKADKPAKEKKVEARKTATAKPAAKATPKPAAAKPKKTIAPEPAISLDDISLRAYFISERRQAMGWPGDSTSDWIEAERQLKAEAARKSKR